MSAAIQIVNREIQVGSKSVLVELVKMDQSEGLLLTEAAKLFQIKEATMWNHLTNHDLWSLNLSRTKLKNLKEQSLIGAKVSRATFLPRDTIRDLAKIINTPVAWEVYRQLWAIVDQAYMIHTQEHAHLGLLKGALDQVVAELKGQTKALLQSAFTSKSEFPEDCIRQKEICDKYFPGVAEAKVVRFLKLTGHPTGNHVHTSDDGIRTTTHPFRKDGIQLAADRFFKERELVKETEKQVIWYHPKLGNMHQRK